MKRLVLLAIVSLTIQGCSTTPITIINDVNPTSRKALPEREEWHHIAFLNFTTFTSPVDMESRCKKNWHSMTFEKSTANFFAGFLIIPPIPFVYGPWNVKYRCRA